MENLTQFCIVSLFVTAPQFEVIQVSFNWWRDEQNYKSTKLNTAQQWKDNHLDKSQIHYAKW